MNSKTSKTTGNIVRHRRLVAENSVFEVFLDDVETEDGRQVSDYLVVAPRNKVGKMITGVAVLPVVQGKVGLIKIYRPAIQGYSWEICRGFVGEEEDYGLSAVRELDEETGLLCVDHNLVSLGFVTPEAGILAARVCLFVAKDCIVKRAFSSEEIGHKEFHLLELPQIESMISISEIQDPCTIVAYYKYRELIKK